MSAHFSKFDLNTYAAFPYFRANVPGDYPLSQVLQTARAFRRLPPNLRELAGLTKRLAVRTAPPDAPAGIRDIQYWYDADGFELDPATGRRLTDAEVDRSWDELPFPPPPRVPLADVPKPAGGFPDPDTWVEPAQPETPQGVEPPSISDIRSWVASYGPEYVSKELGIPVGLLPTAERLVASDADDVETVLGVATGAAYRP